MVHYSQPGPRHHHVAGRLLIAAALLLPLCGTIAYSTAFGGGWWPFGAALIAYNSLLLHGFLNFTIALGLALCLAAAWLRWREHHPAPTILLATIGALILFACHLMGLVFFAFLIGGADLAHLVRQRPRELPRAVLNRAAILLLIFAAPAALYTVSALRQLGGDAEYLALGEKLSQLTTAFVNYDRALDDVTAATVLAVPAISLVLRRGRVPGPAACTMGLLLLAYFAAPYAWKGTFGLDTRFAVMLGFMLFAGFVPQRRLPMAPIAAALLLLFGARMVLLTTAWAERRTDLADLRTVLAQVQPGQAIYFAEAGSREAPAYWHENPRFRILSDGTRTDEHLGALALIEHRAYWPFLFDNESQQPIETREPYRTLANRIGSIPDRDAAATANVCGFDYVLLIEADAVPALPFDRFRLLIRSGFAALYRIEQCS